MAIFRRQWFNPLYFILNKIKKDEHARIILIYGGKGSAKTASVCQFISKESYCYGLSAITFRKESTTIPTTLQKSFELAHKTMYLGNGFEALNRKYNSNVNSSEIVLKGMDDSEKAKGVEGYTYLYFDELNQFLKKEFSDANISLRGLPGQKVIASWNPVDDQIWIKTELIDQYSWTDTDEYGTLPCEHSFIRKSSNGRIILIKTTYEDNYFIAGGPEYGYRDEALIEEYKALEKLDPNSYKVNVLGEWGKAQYGGEFLKGWKSNIHVGDVPYNPNAALYLMFDENVNPYFPCSFYQAWTDQSHDGSVITKHLNLIHIISAKNPNNTVDKMVSEIKRKLREYGHQGIIYIGGDATSQKEDVKQEKGHDLFKLIINGLISEKGESGNPIWDIRRKINSANPSVKVSAQFTNSVLESEFLGIRVRVDRSCRTAINDYENTKEDKNGGVDKSSVRDPETKVSYQPYGHYCDIKRYALVTIYDTEYKQFQTAGFISTERAGKYVKKNSW